MRLIRDNQNDERTFGRLYTEDGQLVAQTLEPPLLPEARLRRLPDVADWPEGTCIPRGTYTCRLRYSPKHGYAVYGLLDVPGFRDVEIHPGNEVLDTLACILPGDSRGRTVVAGKTYDAVLNSRVTFAKLMASWGCPDFKTLTTWDAVRAYILAHPEAEAFPLEVLDP